MSRQKKYAAFVGVGFDRIAWHYDLASQSMSSAGLPPAAPIELPEPNLPGPSRAPQAPASFHCPFWRSHDKIPLSVESVGLRVASRARTGPGKDRPMAHHWGPALEDPDLFRAQLHHTRPETRHPDRISGGVGFPQPAFHDEAHLIQAPPSLLEQAECDLVTVNRTRLVSTIQSFLAASGIADEDALTQARKMVADFQAQAAAAVARSRSRPLGD